MPKQTPLKKRLRKGVFQFVKNRDGQRLPTQFERKRAMTNITHREESRAFRDKIPNISVHQFKRSFGKVEIKTNHYVVRCQMFTKRLSFISYKKAGNHIKGHARDHESHNIWSTHGFTPV